MALVGKTTTNSLSSSVVAPAGVAKADANVSSELPTFFKVAVNDKSSPEYALPHPSRAATFTTSALPAGCFTGGMIVDLSTLNAPCVTAIGYALPPMSSFETGESTSLGSR